MEDLRKKIPQKEYLTNEQVNQLIEKINEGDNNAWELFYYNFMYYVEARARLILKNYCITDESKLEDLVMSGWVGTLKAYKNYDCERGKFLTYTTIYIDKDIKEQLKTLMNTLGITGKPQLYIQPLEDCIDNIPDISEPTKTIDSNSIIRKPYSSERTVIQILQVLKSYTDEKHYISQSDLSKLLNFYREKKYKNSYMENESTLRKNMVNLLSEVNPPEYTEENESEYKVLYEGYKENRIKQIKDGKKNVKITNFSYVHPFSYAELDRLISLVCFSDFISESEKDLLVKKLVATSSKHYRSPFWNDRHITFNPKAVYNRLKKREEEESTHLVDNLNRIQNAINNTQRIQFRFNRFDEQNKLVPTSDYVHIFSPYHLVVYHEHYYCIGLKAKDKRIWHYRVDLMTNVDIKDENGNPLPLEICKDPTVPILNDNWNPEKYMSEHLYMGYDEPRDILIKIKNTDYTILHDWFGEHYKKMNNVCEDGYVVVRVKTSPTMIVSWALQYSGKVEILDDEVRKKIRIEIDKLKKKYEF